MTLLRRAWKFLLWERVAAWALVLVAVVPAIVFTGAVVVKSTYLQAIEQTIRGDGGQSTYQFVDPRDPSPLTASLMHRRDISPVWVARTLLTAKAGAAAVPVDLSTTQPERAQPRFGVLVEGRYADKGELVATRAAVEELGVSVGDTLTLDEGRGSTVRLAGVVVSPTRPGDLAAYCRCASTKSQQPNQWLSDAVPFTDPSLSDAAMGRVLQVRSADSAVVDAQAAAQANELSFLQYIPPFTAAIAFLLCALLAGAMRRRMLPTVEGLRAAEVGPSAAWAIPVAMIGMSVLLGTIIGMAVVVVALQIGAGQMGVIVGQDWQGISVPIGTLVWFGVTVTAATAGASFALLAIPKGHGLRRPTQLRKARLAAVTAAAIGVIIVLLPPGLDGFRDQHQTLLGGALVTASLTALVGWGRSSSGVRQRVAAAASPALLSATLLVAVTVFLGTWFAAYLSNVAAGQGGLNTMQPQGSLVVAGVTGENVTSLSTFDANAGAVVMHSPAEDVSTVRVASPETAQCAATMPAPTIEAVNTRCPLGDSVTPINTVALTRADELMRVPPGAVLADPGLIHNGQVALLTISLTGQITDQLTVPAHPDRRLGGLLPGAVINDLDPAVEALKLRDSNKSTVLFENFGQLKPTKRAALRAAVARRASYAMASETVEATRNPSAILGAFVGWSAAAVAAAMIASIAAAFNASQARLRRLLVDLGVSASDRRRMGWKSLRVLALAAAIAGAAGLIAATAVTSRLDVTTIVWTFPTLAAIAASALARASYGRAPQTDQG